MVKKYEAVNDLNWVRANRDVVAVCEAKLRELHAKAVARIGDVVMPTIYYKALGRTLGVASMQKGGVIMLNTAALDANQANMVNDTIGHEFAHIICMTVPRFRDMGHGKTWKMVARFLGANPVATCTSAEFGAKLEPMRKRSKIIHWYMIGTDKKVLRTKHHTALQKGMILTTGTGIKITKDNYIKSEKVA